MNQKNKPPNGPKSVQSRDDRLKAALKANLGRRKAQARARSAPTDQAAAANEAKSED